MQDSAIRQSSRKNIRVVILASFWFTDEKIFITVATAKTRMWANAQRDGRPAEYRWHPLFNAALLECPNAAKMQNPLKFAGVPQTRQRISAVSRSKFTILSPHVEEVLLFNKFFSDCRYIP